MPLRRKILSALVVLLMLYFAPVVRAAENFILVQSTTSTRNSGLYNAILPIFTEAAGIEVRIVAVGTGQAIRNAANCDGDVLLVHAKAAEEKFVADGFGVERFDLMYNDFIIVGPAGDPAGLKAATHVSGALQKLSNEKTPFVSRGDDSGTHKKELELWAAAGIDPTPASGDWYRETGSGMGATLNVAVGMEAYTMTDRATWIAFANKAGFVIAVEGDASLFNQYGVILVNPDRCPSVKVAGGEAFISWLLSEPGQTAIAAYKLDGKQLFFPNANAIHWNGKR